MGVGVAAEVVLASLMWMMSYTTSVRGGGWRDCVKRNVKAFGSQTRMRERKRDPYLFGLGVLEPSSPCLWAGYPFPSPLH